MKKIFLALSLCACTTLFASEKDYNWEFTPTIGGTLPLSGGLKKTGYKNGVSYGAKIAKNLEDSWFDQIEFGYDYSKLNFKDKEDESISSDKGKLHSYQLNFIKNLGDFSDTTKLYGLFGFGLLKYSDTFYINEDDTKAYAKARGSSPIAQIGLGLKQYFSDNFALRLEVRDAYAFNKIPKSVKMVDENGEETSEVEYKKKNHLLYYSLGFSFDFGRRAPEVVASNVVGDSDNDGVLDNIDRCPNTPSDVVVDEFGCEKIVRVNLGVNFKFDSAKIKENDVPQVKEVADFMNDHKDYKAVIAGYTDSVGSAKYNQKLSEKRANNFAKILKSEGVDPTRITTIGYGEENPIATNETKEGRAQNRRVEAKFRKH